MTTTEHHPQVGESWAYRARQIDDVVEVEVLKLGTQRPPRVLVRFVDERFEGRQEWVSPARLKVRWAAVDGFREHEARWNRIDELGIGDDSVGRAAEVVFETLVEHDVARLEYRESGACRITKSSRLAEITGLDEVLWTQCPDGFTEREDLVAPWPVTEAIAAAAARRNPTPILEAVQKEEGEARYEAIHGRWYRGRGSRPDYTIPADICIQTDNEYYKPRRALLRQWCGAGAVDRYDELVELRKEIHRVGQIAESAIKALRAAGRKREAEHLARQLGTPVEMLRHGES
ncbi:hypothetical protein CQY20_22045 [Mycolicibacterium agri]|uniref:PE-PGRS family protein n=1 Tax=Mycolicibacterium agri TaxID=36811 RepID=A0A2A7MW17_MYCAG|nr:hypothetical protein [Mycolicibacterium agri]PEG35358.1 hypothetical protein CQY20_22045 [Mycolicibacterium agri]